MGLVGTTGSLDRTTMQRKPTDVEEGNQGNEWPMWQPTAGVVLVAGLVLVLAADPVVAQSETTAFCDSSLVKTVKNIFTLIQIGGPLLGGVLALGATVAKPAYRDYEVQKELKLMRNQGILWGVLIAPLGTEIIQFLLNNVVVGAGSCGF